MKSVKEAIKNGVFEESCCTKIEKKANNPESCAQMVEKIKETKLDSIPTTPQQHRVFLQYLHRFILAFGHENLKQEGSSFTSFLTI